MIYTVGNPIVYEPLFDNPEPPKKRGAAPDYVGGSVWKTKEEAQVFADANKYRVYGVDADWELDTKPNRCGKWNDLLIDSKLIKLD